MASFNKVILIGNMTADPELKQTAAGISVCSFSIAINRRFTKGEQNQQTVDFINIVTWRQNAEFVRFSKTISTGCHYITQNKTLTQYSPLMDPGHKLVSLCRFII